MSIPVDDFPGGGGGSQPVTIITSSLNIGNVGTPYFEYLDASNGYPPYVWTLDSGTLPPGLSVDTSGFISGTPTTNGSYTFVISVQDLIGGIDTKELSIQINVATNPTITTTSLPPGPIGIAYSQTILATGGTPPYTAWNVITGTLPTGLTLSSSGVLSGTPTVAGTYNFTVEVTDSASVTDIQAFSLIIQSNSPTITTTSLSSGTTGITYSSTISATGGITPYTNWEVLSGTLPPGLLLTSSPTIATLSGTPTASGVFVFTVQVTDSNLSTDTQLFSLTVNNGTIPTIYTGSLPFAPLNIAYSTFIQASGGALPYTWSVFSGTLPTGLTLNSTTGEISGTPTVTGSYVFTIKVQDYNGNTNTKLFAITVGNYILPAIITDSLPNGIVSISYSTYIQGIGGALPYVWSILGSLPPGLSINSVTGQISGTPTTAGSYTFNVILIDDSLNVDINTFTIQIGDGSLPLILTTSLPDGNLDISYSEIVLAGGGTPGYTWSISSGSLPLGLTLSPSGVISGIPTSIGLYNFTLLVTDSDTQTDTQAYTIVIKSTGFDSSCCYCVFTDEIVEFTTNGSGGVLNASGGTILSNTKWQAPSVPGVYDVYIQVEGINGNIFAYNTITVIEKLKIVNVTKDLDYLLPGDTFDIVTNYNKEDVIWETLDCDIPIITPSGTVVITSNAADTCFGAMECTVRGTLTLDNGCNESNYVDLKIKVNPIFPTPNNCGPYISKWLREGKEFKVIITEFEGGCTETHIKNKVPTIRWTINYEGLNNYQTSETNCPSCSKCIIDCNCKGESQFTTYTGGCHPVLRSANRLDDFWNFVYGQYKTFTLIDYDTGETWYNVRFSDNPSYDHRHRKRSNSRSFKLIWKPCCSQYPMGGTCSKHGMFNYKTTTLNSSSCMYSNIDTSSNCSTSSLNNCSNLFDRTYSKTTNSLLNLNTESGIIKIDDNVIAEKIIVNQPCRIRLYLTSVQRDADLSRPYTTQIEGDHGMLLEIIFVSGDLELDLSPAVSLYTLDSSSYLYYTIQNTSGITTPITFNITGLVLKQ